MLFQTQKANFVRPLASIMEGLSSTQKVCCVELVKANPPLPAKDHDTNPDFQVSSWTKTSLPAISTCRTQSFPSKGKTNSSSLTLWVICFNGCQKRERPRRSSSSIRGWFRDWTNDYISSGKRALALNSAQRSTWPKAGGQAVSPEPGLIGDLAAKLGWKRMLRCSKDRCNISLKTRLSHCKQTHSTSHPFSLLAARLAESPKEENQLKLHIAPRETRPAPSPLPWQRRATGNKNLRQRVSHGQATGTRDRNVSWLARLPPTLS